MGRTWYLEAWATNMGDAQGLLDGIRNVCRQGKAQSYYWNEPTGADANGGPLPWKKQVLRVSRQPDPHHEFLLGVEFGLDGTLQLAPAVPEEFWKAGFGQTLMSARSAFVLSDATQPCDGRLSQPRTAAIVHKIIAAG